MAALAAALALLTACGVPPAPADTVPVVLETVEPDVALPGTTVTLLGEGFTPELTLRLDGVAVPTTVEAPDRLTFSVPDTPGYPRIELGEASAERLLFVGADYAGPLTAAALQAALDELAPGIALRLPSGTVSGDHLVLGARWLYGRGAEAGGTRLEIVDTAWYLQGSGLAELTSVAGQHVIRRDAPLDPGTPFEAMGVGREPDGGIVPGPRAAGAAVATRARDVRFAFNDTPIPWFHAGSPGLIDLERVSISRPTAPLYVAGDAVRMVDVDIDVAEAHVFAWTDLELRDVGVRTRFRQSLRVPDAEAVRLERVDLDAGMVIEIEVGYGAPSTADVEVRGLTVSADELLVRSFPHLSLEDLTATVERTVSIEGILDGLTITTGGLTAGGVALVADLGALRLRDVDLDLAFDGLAVDLLVDPATAFLYGNAGVEVEGGTWTGSGVEVESGAAPIALSETVATATAGVWVNASDRGDVALDGVTLAAAELRVEGIGVVLSDARLTGSSSLFVDAVGALAVRDAVIASGSLGMNGEAGFELLRSTVSSNVGGTIASSEGAGLVEDTVFSIRSSNGITLAGSTRLTLRRVHFQFGLGLVFVAPPGELVLEQVTGADDATTPGQP